MINCKDKIFPIKKELTLRPLEKIYFYIYEMDYRELPKEKYLEYFEKKGISKKTDDNETVIKRQNLK